MSGPDLPATLRYRSGDFEIIMPGAYVRCAVTGERIPLGELRYWSFERQEAYLNAEAATRTGGGCRRPGTTDRRGRVIARLALALVLSVCAGAVGANGVELDGNLIQGGLALGSAPPGTEISLNGRPLRISGDGGFVLGFGRDAPRHATLHIRYPDGSREALPLRVRTRRYETQRIDGLPERMVTPGAEALKRIRRENSRIAAVRRPGYGPALLPDGLRLACHRNRHGGIRQPPNPQRGTATPPLRHRHRGRHRNARPQPGRRHRRAGGGRPLLHRGYGDDRSRLWIDHRPVAPRCRRRRRGPTGSTGRRRRRRGRHRAGHGAAPRLARQLVRRAAGPGAPRSPDAETTASTAAGNASGPQSPHRSWSQNH